jgi:hypothetical protein
MIINIINILYLHYSELYHVITLVKACAWPSKIGDFVTLQGDYCKAGRYADL